MRLLTVRKLLALLSAASLASSSSWTQQKGYNCYSGHGATEIDKGPIGKMTVEQCEAKCDEDSTCTAITYATSGAGGSSEECWRRKEIQLSACDKGSPYDTYMKGSAPPSPPAPPAPAPPAPSGWTQEKGYNCFFGHGASEIDKGPIGKLTVAECEDKCNEVADCTAITYATVGGDCWRRKDIQLSACDKGSSYDTYINGPAPGPTPPAPPSPYNPLNIQALPRRSDNFFLVIGDWGAPNWAARGCQERVASMMKDYVKKYEAQGKKCLFVGAVGDNFYATGVENDAHWASQWGNVYGTNDPNSPLYNIPWLAVLGNHDYGSADPTCACGQGCKQFNGAHRPGGTEKFWMPDYSWYYEIPGAELAIIGHDTNSVDAGGLGGDGCGGGAAATCQRCGGQGNIQRFLDGKKAEGEGLIDQHARTTTAKTVLLMQHYNGLGKKYKDRFDSQHPGEAKVLAAYGHAHDQVCQGDRTNGCDVILTGGGGGWQGGGYFGFTAVHLTDDGGFQTVLETSEVRFSQNSCNYLTDNMTSNTVQEAFV